MTKVLGCALAVVGVAAGCGDDGGNNKRIDAGVITDDGMPDMFVAPDVGIDANNCMVDEFDGSALDAHWTVTQGAAATDFVVANGSLTINDSPLVDTPSNIDESWINDLDTDKGNQWGWAQAIGTGDFTLSTHVNWTGTSGELHIAAVGVADSAGTIVALAGAYDGGQGADGEAWVKINGLGGADDDIGFEGPQEEPGSADFRIERTGGVLHMLIDDVEVAMGTNATAISHVVIVHAPYRLNTTNYAYGTGEITKIEICR